MIKIRDIAIAMLACFATSACSPAGEEAYAQDRDTVSYQRMGGSGGLSFYVLTDNETGCEYIVADPNLEYRPSITPRYVGLQNSSTAVVKGCK